MATNRMEQEVTSENRVAGKVENGEPWTVMRLLEWTTGFFKSKGSDSARLDAEVLLAAARDCERIELYAAFNDVPGDEVRAAFREMVRRRGGGVPVAQLVGHKEFYSHKFRVDESTLIPRPETEHVVIEAVDRIKTLSDLGRSPRVADIGTGSGVIALSIAAHMKNTDVTATDMSESALSIARYNASKMSLDDRVKMVSCDLLAGVDSPTTFDIICSNPPYVTEAEYDQLDPGVRDHEPKTALVSGPSGTEVIERILVECLDRLEPQGWFIIELSPMIAAAAKAFAESTGTFCDVALVKDLARHDRVLVCRKSAG